MVLPTVSLIGLGALGVLFGQKIAETTPPGTLRVIADDARAARYARQGVYANGRRVDFTYIPPDAAVPPADLLIFAVKAAGLSQAIEDARSQVGENTLVLSLLNGIGSEKELARAYGADKVLYCVAQGMDATKTGNRLTYQSAGKLVFGEETGPPTTRVQVLAAFCEYCGIACEMADDMQRVLWSKFMLNCGVNQAAMVFETDYGGLQKPGAARSAMQAAMREVLQIARQASVPLDEEDVAYWMDVLARLAPRGMPSMRQDALARRPSEVAIFAGTVRLLGRKYGVPTPVNDGFYDTIALMEQAYRNPG